MCGRYANTRSDADLKDVFDIVEAIGDVESVANAIALSVDEQSRATAEIAHQVRLSFEGAQRSADVAGGFEVMTRQTHGAAYACYSASASRFAPDLGRIRPR